MMDGISCVLALREAYGHVQLRNARLTFAGRRANGTFDAGETSLPNVEAF